eukprot:3197105-Alexandrium_andersonii.AAC.1
MLAAPPRRRRADGRCLLAGSPLRRRTSSRTHGRGPAGVWAGAIPSRAKAGRRSTVSTYAC